MSTPRHYDGMATIDPVRLGNVHDERFDALVRALRERVDAEVRFDAGSRAAYSTDASNYRQVPIGVVIPRSVDAVVDTVRVCREHDAPITSRGGGTSLAGQGTNAAVIVDCSKYVNRVREIDPVEKLAVVEPGCNLDVLRAAARVHGLTYGPDPSTHDRNTMGGMIGNNSCGVHSVLSEFYGPGPLTVDHVVSLDVLTYDGVRLTVGATDSDELDAIVAQGGRRAEIYGGLRELRDRHEPEIRKRFPDIPRRVSGFNLDRLLPEHGFHVAQALVGTEGTCVVVLHATLRLVDDKPARTLVVFGYDDVYDAAADVPAVREHRPVGLEGIDAELVEDMRRKGLHPRDADLLPKGKAFLLIEFGADDRADSERDAHALVDALGDGGRAVDSKVFDDQWEEKKLWQVREAGLGATARVPGKADSHPGWEDAAVPPEALSGYLRDFRALLDDFGYHAALYGHFGQGCVHCRIDFTLDTDQGVRRWRAFLERAASLVVSYGGSLSGEHGDGQARAALLGQMYGDELVGAFADFKDLWDPANRMNPGKVVRPAPPDAHLRLGPDASMRHPRTYFAFPDDDFDFARATQRCVGVGKCRDVDSGTMCPSYMATREEEDSTRGRARMLFELMRGDELRGWRDDAVADALDLCLACKGCKTECPLNVDMATYKAEFLAHHYRGRLRPRVAYSMGLIYWWARAGSHLPRIVNALAHAPGTRSLLKRAGGVASERTIPRFATSPFHRRFHAEAPRDRRPASDVIPRPRRSERPRYVDEDVTAPTGRDAPLVTDRVLLWPDTFNNYLDSPVLDAAVSVLADAGYAVELPPRPLCCGRPLYDFGMLPTAKRLWRQTLRTLRPWIRAGVPVVGVEPSCVAAFRDELVNLFPHDDDARRLAGQTFMLSEFLHRQGYEPPRLSRSVLVHGHCHHESVIGMDDELDLLDRMGLDVHTLDSGCCGMAGSFGFAAGHYEVSQRVGERVLLPAVRDLPSEQLVVTDGFSCREQIEQATGRIPVHFAELLQLALREHG
jgi:FAD/FMN-containing dehydrogenase/Fe-S oxidoreductase